VTLWEGFDLPIVEAQAMGKPVVAYDIGPHSELIDSQGILTPVKDIEKFAAAIEVVLHRKHGA
jgi:1,2-diacylglycerol 3-alpha-glucosyltransferase